MRLASRPTASYTPLIRDGRHTGLLVERPEGAATRASFRVLTGGDDGVRRLARLPRGRRRASPAWSRRRCSSRCRPSATSAPQVDAEVWADLVTNPLGRDPRAQRFADDTVRGVVATDALIGTFASLDDPSLVQNRTFLYHVIGNGTGEWRVPVGGMGAVTDALARAADLARAPRSSPPPGVSAIRAGDDGAEVTWQDGRRHPHRLARASCWATSRRGCCRSCSATPTTRDQAAGRPAQDQPPARPAAPAHVGDRPAGRVRRHRCTSARATSSSRRRTPRRPPAGCPTTIPGEVYCHSLTDPSILGDLAGQGGTP